MIAEHGNGYGCNDFRGCYETLFQTESGAFFLSGSGGPMSKYAQSSGNMITGGSRIVPLSKDDAYNWCEQHDQIETIERYFSNRLQDA